jgi:hypothetical protein
MTVSVSTERAFQIVGRVIDRATRRGQAGLRLEVLDRDPGRDDLLGTVVTDRRGVFRIEFSESSFRDGSSDRRPDVYFKVYRGDQLVRSTEDGVLSQLDEQITRVTIEVEAAAPPRQPGPFVIGGRLVNAASGYPLAGLRVGAYFVEPPSDGREPPAPNQPSHLLGEGVSGSDGRFGLAFADTPLVRQRL